MKTTMLVLAVAMALLSCSKPATETSADLSPVLVGLALAEKSNATFEALRPQVVGAIQGLVETSRVRSLAAPERDRLMKLNYLRKVADSWMDIHNAYLDILAATEYFIEKKDRTAQEEVRLSQLLFGLPRNTAQLDDLVKRMDAGCKDVGLKGGI